MENEAERLIRLLIVDDGMEKAEKAIGALQTAGLQVRAKFAENSANVAKTLGENPFDLLLFSIDLPDFSLEQVQRLLTESGRLVATIAMTSNPTPEVVVAAISQGARDVVSSDSFEHLILVTKREAYSQSLWHQMKRAELRLHESEKRYQSLLAHSRDAVAYLHDEGKHIYANPAYLALIGKKSLAQLNGTPLINMVDKKQQGELKKYLLDFRKKEQPRSELKLSLVKSNGATTDVTVEFSRATFEAESCTQVLVRAVSETSELEEQINYLHQHDLVTGLYNRQSFMGKLKSALTLALNGIRQSALIYIAIDDFQSVRDRVGISGCDIFMSKTAKLIQKRALKQQFIARFGAWSFTCLGIFKDKQLIEKFCAEVIADVADSLFEIDDQSISVTCSIGICFIDQNSPDSPNELISRVENTCNEVHESGGNSVGTFVPKQDEMTDQEHASAITEMIKDAIKNNRVTVLYQPIVSITDAGGEHYFSSLEITDEDGNIIEHKASQVSSDKTGTTKTLDRYLIMQAINHIAEATKASRKTRFFVPLSLDSMMDTSLIDWISDNLKKSGGNSDYLILTMSEYHAVSQLKAAKTFSEGVKKIGCLFALDDFGTGLNPFQLMKHISTDYIRVNAAYMEDLPQSPENQESIRELATQAESMKIRTITPAVDDAAILSVLWSVGIDYMQGGFLQEPQKTLDYDFSAGMG